MIIFLDSKAAFQKNVLILHRKRVHNEEVYDYLIGKWEEKNNKKRNCFYSINTKINELEVLKHENF